MQFRSVLLVGLLSAACSAASTESTQPDARLATEPAALHQIDRVSLLAWKETLGPKYPLTVARADSIAMILDFFSTAGTGWREQGELTQTPMFAGFYRGQSLESERGFLEFCTAPAVCCSFESAESCTVVQRPPPTSIGF